MAKLFIVGFPKDMEEIELVEMFSVHGTVNTVTIVTDMETGTSKGYGFITMTDDAGAGRAIASLDGISIHDRVMNVRMAEDKSQAKPAPPKIGFKKGDPSRLARLNPFSAESPRKKRPRR